MHDKVIIDGRIDNTPTVRFAGKSHLISDLMGEKLTDSFVTGVLSRLLEREAHSPTFAMLAPDLSEAGCGYTLFVNEEVSRERTKELDALLSENPQYAYCRKLNQLSPPRLYRITADAYAGYADRLHQRGQRLGDIKPVALSTLDGWSGVFNGFYIPSPSVL